MTLMICLGIWIALQAVAVLWLGSIARALGVTRSDAPKATGGHNFAA